MNIRADLVNDTTLSPNAKMIFCFMQMYLRGDTPAIERTFHKADVIFEMTGRATPNNRDWLVFNNGYKELLERGYIFAYDIKNSFYINTQISFESNQWVLVDGDALKKIVRSKIRNRAKVVALYLRICATLPNHWKKNKRQPSAAYYSQDRLAKEVGIDVQSVGRFWKRLDEMEIIYTYHNRPKMTNTYGFYCDRDYVDQIGRRRDKRSD